MICEPVIVFARRAVLLMQLVVLFSLPLFLSTTVEEYHIHGPTELHNIAMDTFLEYRKEVDSQATLGYDSPLMERAQKHAVKRLIARDEQDLIIRRQAAITEEGGASSVAMLQLPAPDTDTVLASSLTSQSSSSGNALISQHEAHGMAVAFEEDVGLGAISKTGALPLGEGGTWIKLAEEKTKKENKLDYQALLWELGNEVTERRQIERGGLNVTMEQEVLDKMKDWFVAGGGKLNFVDPKISQTDGGSIVLVSTEHIGQGEKVVSVPLKLVMCKQTARNVLIKKRGKYLGEELAKTFDKDEVWGMAIFLLHEYYKEINGDGSKWGPFLRTLRVRFLTTDIVQELRGTRAAQLSREWLKNSDSFMWWSTGSDGPCSPISGICKTKPNENTGDSRFSLHQIRWAYWVVKQNAVRIRQLSTGLEFVALVPFYNMVEKRMEGFGGGVSFDLEGSVNIHAGVSIEEAGVTVSLNPGNLTDPEFFMRYFRLPDDPNTNNFIPLSLPGALPRGSKFHFCMKGTARERNKDVCKGAYKSESMFWKTKVLGEWRARMNLPPRLTELRMWATRLHLYGGQEEMALLSAANQMIAGLPIPVDQMSAEEQLMLMGGSEASRALSVIQEKMSQEDRPPPQLYSAPDPSEDPEAQRAMEALASLAVQAQSAIAHGNVLLNATMAVLNHTRDFFLHGVLPSAGLDELDEFLLKKIGIIAHCGFEDDMKISNGNITDELMCAMRVHLMNESEVHVFCPKDVRVWEENCHNVEFMNYTAISETNELAVIDAFRLSLRSLLSSYPHTAEEDTAILLQRKKNTGEAGTTLGPVMASVVLLRLREKQVLIDALAYLAAHEVAVRNGSVSFQLDLKSKERVEANEREAERKAFVEKIQQLAAIRAPLASVEVDMGPNLPKRNLTLEEGASLKDTVSVFCRQHGIGDDGRLKLEDALKKRVVNPSPLDLLLGVVVPTGDRKILAIPQGANSSLETAVFCAKNNITSEDACDAITERVKNRVFEVPFDRRIIVIVPIDAPDTRQLKLVVREGEQHDLRQFVADFFQLYHMPSGSVDMMTNEVYKRLPAAALRIPVNIAGRRRVEAIFFEKENVTATVEGFANFFEIDENTKIQLTRLARYGMAPGSYLV